MSLPIPTKPAAARQFTLSGGGVSLTLPSTTAFNGNRGTASNFIENLPGLDGGVKVRNTSFDPLTLNFSGFFTNATQLMNFAAIVGSRTITVSTGRFAITGEVSDYEFREIQSSQLYSFSVEIRSLDSYWVGPTSTVSGFNSPGLNIRVLSVTNPSPLDVEPIIRITKLTTAVTTPTFASIVFGNAAQGQIFSIDDFTIGVDEVMEVNYKKLTTTINGVNSLSKVSDSFFLTQSYLAPLSTTLITIGFPNPYFAEVSFEERVPGPHIS